MDSYGRDLLNAGVAFSTMFQSSDFSGQVEEDGGILTTWKVFPDNNKKGSYNAYEKVSTKWDGDPTDVYEVHNNDGSIDIYNSTIELNKAGIKNVNRQYKNDKGFVGNLKEAYDGWVNATGRTAAAKETMYAYIGGVASVVIPEIAAEFLAARVGTTALSASKLKSIASYENQIAKHQTKLLEYMKNPMKFDNKGFLKNAPNDAVRQQIIQSRINHLNHEIQTFRNNIQKIINGG
ncbi:hypothetical protein [Paenimyroides aestuarii]|uniref:Uncharacterized protein n=1 Tax=Paenimyroides aestuarii TaxID=2968490 RepID=A0ABY5NUE8_9FLAO|nr:hypothetical protein [Paenimyroides aestuarii]UUV22017.1 hypothetical protein NPX36_02940 [Paenimyroides aestuarii]